MQIFVLPAECLLVDHDCVAAAKDHEFSASQQILLKFSRKTKKKKTKI